MQPSEVLAVIYLAAWLSAASVIIRCHWQKIQPGISAFLVLGAIQATSCVLAGPTHSVWWWTRIWAPIEILVLEAAFYATLESVMSWWWLLLGGLVGGLTFPFGAFSAGGLLYVRAGVDMPEWYWAFLRIREWSWISTVAAVAMHSLWLIWRPVALLPAVYRSRWLFAMFALCAALGGSRWPETGTLWLRPQAMFRGGVIILLVRWCLLAPTMAAVTAQYSVGPGAAGRNPRAV